MFANAVRVENSTTKFSMRLYLVALLLGLWALDCSAQVREDSNIEGWYKGKESEVVDLITFKTCWCFLIQDFQEYEEIQYQVSNWNSTIQREDRAILTGRRDNSNFLSYFIKLGYTQKTCQRIVTLQDCLNLKALV